MSTQRVRAVHPASSNVLTGEVIARNGSGDVTIIPDGLLEEVVLRAGVWDISAESAERPTPGFCVFTGQGSTPHGEVVTATLDIGVEAGVTPAHAYRVGQDKVRENLNASGVVSTICTLHFSFHPGTP